MVLAEDETCLAALGRERALACSAAEALPAGDARRELEALVNYAEACVSRCCASVHVASAQMTPRLVEPPAHLRVRLPHIITRLNKGAGGLPFGGA